MHSPPLFQRLWSNRWLRLLGLVCFALVLSYNLRERHVEHHALWQDLDGKIHEANRLVNEEFEVANFGAMANRLSAIAEVAELMTNHSMLDRQPLMRMLEETFPWWIQTKPIYTPWNETGFKKGGSIIMTVGKGNAQLAANLIVGLRNVLGSKLPIEIAYAGSMDLPLRTREKLRQLGPDIHLIDMTEVFDDDYIKLHGGGYAMKPFAVLASQYQQTMLMDADVVFFQPPDNIFTDHPGFAKTGTLFYHDRSAFGDGSRSEWVKELLEAANREPSPYLNQSIFYKGETGEEADSGLVVYDKTRPAVFMSLMFTAWMNTRVREQITYHRVYGDKETYWLAPELMGVEYYFQPWYAGNVGVINEIFPPEPDENGEYPEDDPKGDSRVKICSRQMLHMDYSGITPFWVNGGLYFDKLEPNRGYAGWTHWYIGEPYKMISWSWENDQYESQWCCVTPRADRVHEIGPDLHKTIQRMIYESEKIEGFLPGR